MSFPDATTATASYRRQTRAKGGEAWLDTGESAPAGGVWCVISPADGHQWEWHDGEWTKMTDREDAYVQEVARAKKRKARD